MRDCPLEEWGRSVTPDSQAGLYRGDCRFLGGGVLGPINRPAVTTRDRSYK